MQRGCGAQGGATPTGRGWRRSGVDPSDGRRLQSVSWRGTNEGDGHGGSVPCCNRERAERDMSFRKTEDRRQEREGRPKMVVGPGVKAAKHLQGWAAAICSTWSRGRSGSRTGSLADGRGPRQRGTRLRRRDPTERPDLGRGGENPWRQSSIWWRWQVSCSS